MWISLFNYFCQEKNLHNLLWVYAPGYAASNVSLYYPGDDYVDIVALDVYVDDPVILTDFFKFIYAKQMFLILEYDTRIR